MEPAQSFLPWPRRLSRLLDRAWARGIAKRPNLDGEAILDAAKRREGAAPDDGAWRQRLDLLCASLNEEANLNSLGLTIAYGQLVRIVASRIRAERWLKRLPDLLDRPVAAPVILVGQMRSGTTRAHRLLACDPGFAHIRLFETLEPVAFGRFADRRPLSAMTAMALTRLCNPALAAIHPSRPFAPEEDFGLHAFSLWGAQFEGQWRVPSFVASCEGAPAADVEDVYRETRTLLQLIGAVRGLDLARPWVLKAPQYCQDLDALRTVFPDARIVRLAREPERVVGSGASLGYHQRRIQSDAADPAEAGEEWLRKTALREQRLTAALKEIDHLVVDYDEMSSDWRGAVARIYRFLDRPLRDEVDQRMARFIDGPAAHHGHHYTLEEFGLDRLRVRAAFVS